MVELQDGPFGRVVTMNPEAAVNGKPVPDIAFMFANLGTPEWVENTPTTEELEGILALTEQGLKEGGIGMPWGYAPGAGLGELGELWSLAAKYNQPTYTHIQNLSVVEPNSGRSNTVELIGLAAAICANLWARQTLRPTSITLLPAIVLLVSGSIGFRGLVAIAVGQTATGEQQFMQMFVVALTIAAGLLVGNTIVQPKTTL